MDGRDQRTAASGWFSIAALVVVGVGVGVIVWYVAAAGPSIHAEGLGWPALLVTIVSYGVVGAVLIDRRPDLPFGWLLAGTAAAGDRRRRYSPRSQSFTTEVTRRSPISASLRPTSVHPGRRARHRLRPLPDRIAVISASRTAILRI
ncbi:MAG: hypothetical protein R2697_12335 [Ilumatobacteraceae bacterium]